MNDPLYNQMKYTRKRNTRNKIFNVYLSFKVVAFSRLKYLRYCSSQVQVLLFK